MTEDEISRIEKQADADDDVEDEGDIDEVVTLWATASVQRRELLNEVKRLRAQLATSANDARETVVRYLEHLVITDSRYAAFLGCYTTPIQRDTYGMVAAWIRNGVDLKWAAEVEVARVAALAGKAGPK